MRTRWASRNSKHRYTRSVAFAVQLRNNFELCNPALHTQNQPGVAVATQLLVSYATQSPSQRTSHFLCLPFVGFYLRCQTHARRVLTQWGMNWPLLSPLPSSVGHMVRTHIKWFGISFFLSPFVGCTYTWMWGLPLEDKDCPRTRTNIGWFVAGVDRPLWDNRQTWPDRLGRAIIELQWRLYYFRVR